MLALQDAFPDGMAGDVSLELIPGEEDCVGLGTLTALVRGYRPDGLIVLEPTNNVACSSSRGGLRFEITCRGRAVHGTVKWLGDDAIRRQRRVLAVLDEIEQAWNDRGADERFSGYPLARPITVDSIHGGKWQGMVCDECTCAGYLELLPGDDLEQWQQRFREAVTERMKTDHDSVMISVVFTEIYSGHRTDSADPFIVAADEAIGASARSTGISGQRIGFNSGCEAGLRANLQGTPTLVWGPGSLEQAHSIDERIEWTSVQKAAQLFEAVARRWCC
jgi:acetylornithine deacetylase